MTDANVESLRAFLDNADLEGWARGEIDASLFDPDIAYEDTVLPDDTDETHLGFDGFVRASKRWLEPFEDPSLELREIVGTGDQLVSVQRFRARGRITGIEVDVTYANRWTFKGGKVVHYKSYSNLAQALRDVEAAQ